MFVLEGTAPALKYGVIAKRNEIQFRGAAPRKAQKTDGDCNTQTKGKSKNKGRTRFNYVQKQCEELIMSMGLECVQGPGEAEAFCAQLNAVEVSGERVLKIRLTDSIPFTAGRRSDKSRLGLFCVRCETSLSKLFGFNPGQCKCQWRCGRRLRHRRGEANDGFRTKQNDCDGSALWM